MPDKNAPGKRVSQEQSIINKLKSMVKSDSKVYWILWRYAPELLEQRGVKTFKDLASKYSVFTSGMTEEHCDKWSYEANVQSAIRFILERIHQKKLIELYNIYFDAAKKDVQSFKAFINFSDRFFATKGKDELLTIIQKANLNDNTDNDENFDF